MSDQPGAAVPSDAPRMWDSVRWLREPLAWTLLALAAIIVLISACQLFKLAGATIPVATPAPVAQVVPGPVGSGPVTLPNGSPAPIPAGASPAPVPASSSPAPVSAFDLRASAVAPQFIDAAVQLLPVLAVLLVAFSGGLTERARQVVQAAAAVLAAAFVFSLISLVGAAATHLRPGTWFILESTGVAITAAALIFTGAVLWSRPFRMLALGFYDDKDLADEDLADDPELGEQP
jgi:hypothetical protein